MQSNDIPIEGVSASRQQSAESTSQMTTAQPRVVNAKLEMPIDQPDTVAAPKTDEKHLQGMRKLSECSSEDQSKTPKPNVHDDIEVMMNITDINDQCLMHIFKKLDLNDLQKVADTAKRFQNATKLVYASKYGNKNVIFNSSIRTSSIIVGVENIWIEGSSNILKVLRHYGHSIKKLEVDYRFTRKDLCHEIDRYISEYCAESVVELRVKGASWTLDNFSKPFIKTKTVEVEHSIILRHALQTDLNKCFPNLCDLKLWYVTDFEGMAVHLPHLNRFEVYVNHVQNFSNWLKKNPQLQNVRLSGSFLNFESLQIISRLPQLTSLGVFLDYLRYPLYHLDSASKLVHFKTLSKFEIFGTFLRWLMAREVSLSFDQLEELSIFDIFDTTFIDFIRKHPSITKLTLRSIKPFIGRGEMSRLANALPSVVEVCFRWCQVPIDDAVDFIKECKFLKKFAFEVESTEALNTLHGRLGKEWRVSIDRRNVAMER